MIYGDQRGENQNSSRGEIITFQERNLHTSLSSPFDRGNIDALHQIFQIWIKYEH